MKYFYDCEFLEDGRTIELISIGIVAEDGREYYAIADLTIAMVDRIRRHEWLMANVVPHLPQPEPRHAGDARLFDYTSGLIKPKAQIAAEVRDFLLAADSSPELWAWYGAYDHVALCQLWGRMIDLPEGIPMWTNDLRQECHRLGNPTVPEQDGGEHHALADARHLRVIDAVLKKHDQEAGRGE